MLSTGTCCCAAPVCQTVCVTVTGCTVVLAGVAVTITGPGGFAASGNTDSMGHFCAPATTVGTYTATVSSPPARYQAGSTTITVGAACITYMGTLTLAPASGYHCGCVCGAMADTLHLSFGGIGVDLVYGGLAAYPTSWAGCHVFAATPGVSDCSSAVPGGPYGPPPADLPVWFLWGSIPTILGSPVEGSGCGLVLLYPAMFDGSSGQLVALRTTSCTPFSDWTGLCGSPFGRTKGVLHKSYSASGGSPTNGLLTTSCGPFLATGVVCHSSTGANCYPLGGFCVSGGGFFFNPNCGTGPGATPYLTFPNDAPITLTE